MDNFVADRLREWGLEQLIEEFDRQKIDPETFLSIPEEGVGQIIQLIGWRYTFLRKRAEYLEKNAVKVSEIDSTSRLLTITNTEERDPPQDENKAKDDENKISNGQELRRLLKTNPVGQYLLKKAKNLNASDRSDLVRVIIEHQMVISFTIKKERFIFWTNEIIAVFPKENKDTYYIPYKKDEQVAAGKLYDKYTNLRRKFISINLLSHKPNKSISTTELDRSDIDKLRNVSIEDHEAIKDLWIKTHSFRMVELKEIDSISSYFERYPMLEAPIGSTLISLDFTCSYGFEDEYIFMKIWPELSCKLIQAAKKKSICKSILSDLDPDTSTDIKGLIILPYMFRPTQTKSEKQKKWTPTYKEQADSFILFIDHMNDLQKSLEDRAKQLKKHRNSSQPFVVAVGNPKKIEACYVIIETVKYKYQNILAAVDLCFKSFFALDLKYPSECELIWLFIEREIYGLNKDFKKSPAISSLLSDLQSVNLVTSENEESSE